MGANFDFSGTGAVVKLSINDGNKNVDISIDKDTVIDGVGTKVGNGASVTQAVIKQAIQKQLSDAGSTLTANFANNKLTFTSQDQGPNATISVTGGGGNVGIGFTNAGGVGTAVAGSTGVAGSTTGAAGALGSTVDLSGTNAIRFTVSDGSVGNHTTNVVVDQNTVVNGQAIGANASQANVLQAINAQLAASNSKVSATNGGGNTLTLTNRAKAGPGNDATVTNNLSSVDIGLGRATAATAFVRGAGTAAAAWPRVRTPPTAPPRPRSPGPTPSTRASISAARRMRPSR